MGPSGHLSCREMSSVAASLFSSVKWGSPALGRGGGARFEVGGWTELPERRGWGGVRCGRSLRWMGRGAGSLDEKGHLA